MTTFESIDQSTDPPTDLHGLWSLERLAERILAEGVTGLVALGTAGEPATLTSETPTRRRDL